MLKRVRIAVFEFISVDDFHPDELRAFKTRTDRQAEAQVDAWVRKPDVRTPESADG